MYDKAMRYSAFLAYNDDFADVGLLIFQWTGSGRLLRRSHGCQSSVIRYELPDHSVAWLNAGSTLRYPIVFRKDNRSVELKGKRILKCRPTRNVLFM